MVKRGWFEEWALKQIPSKTASEKTNLPVVAAGLVSGVQRTIEKTDLSEVVVTQSLFTYTPTETDERLITSTGVDRKKTDMEVARIDASQHTIRWWGVAKHVLVHVGSSIAGAAAAVYGVGEALAKHEPVSETADKRFGQGYAYVDNAPTSTYLKQEAMVDQHKLTEHYVPHMLSAIRAESGMCSAETAKINVYSQMNRCDALPVPDAEALQWKRGTAEIATMIAPDPCFQDGRRRTPLTPAAIVYL